MRDDILECAVLHAETARNDTQLLKAQLLVQPQRRLIGSDHSIELQNVKAKLLRLTHAVLHQFFSNMPPAQAALDRIACVADMPTAADVVRVQNVQSDDFTIFRIIRDAGKRLCRKECMTALCVQQFGLRKRDAVLYDFIPNRSRLAGILLRILSDFHLHDTHAPIHFAVLLYRILCVHASVPAYAKFFRISLRMRAMIRFSNLDM